MKRILYLGTDPTHFELQGNAQDRVIHFPVIQVRPREHDHPEVMAAYDDLDDYTHVIFTSKNTVKIFVEHLQQLGKRVEDLDKCQTLAIGSVTAGYLKMCGISPKWTAEQETQEGIVSLLNTLLLEDAYVFLPKSSLSRPVLINFFHEREIRYQACDLYETVTHHALPLPDLSMIDEIMFTSPSTVKAFMEIFGALPQDKTLLAIGPITQEALKHFSTRLSSS